MSYPRFIGKVIDNTAYLEDEEFHHSKVKRIKEGYFIEINDLKGNVYLAKVVHISKKQLKAEIIKLLSVYEEDLQIHLYLCMPNKLSKVDELIEPISQLGVFRLIPVISQNSSIKEKDIQKKLQKWHKIALNSIKQCKRLFPIEISEPIKLKDISSDYDFRFVFYEKEENKTIKDFLNKDAKKVSIVIGSEGGFTKKEIEFLKNIGYIPLSLGKNILKLETAVISAVCQTKLVFN